MPCRNGRDVLRGDAPNPSLCTVEEIMDQERNDITLFSQICTSRKTILNDLSKKFVHVHNDEINVYNDFIPSLWTFTIFLDKSFRTGFSTNDDARGEVDNVAAWRAEWRRRAGLDYEQVLLSCIVCS